MNAKPVRGADDPSRKKTDKSSPPPEAFREQLKISEVDPEAQSKWKNMQKQYEDVSSVQGASESTISYSSAPDSSSSESIYSSPPPQTSPDAPPQTYEGNIIPSSQPTTQTSQPETYSQPLPMQSQSEPLPVSYDFYHENNAPVSTQKTEDQSSPSSDQNQQEEKKEATLDKKELETPQTKGKIIKKNGYKKEAASLPEKRKDQTEKQTIEGAPLEVRTSSDQTIGPKTDEKPENKPGMKVDRAIDKQAPIKIDKQTTDTNISYKKDDRGGNAPKKEKGDKMKEPAPVQAHSLSLTPEIEQAAYQAVQSVSSYIDPKVEALFQNMVGAIIQTTKKGISKTEFVLNQPNLKSTQFYGSKITLTKYSTSPNSFNIFLSTSNSKALTQFTNQLSSLKTAFIQGNFDFKVGRLEAHYKSDRKEGFLFRRKEGAGEKDTGSKKEEK